VVDLQDSHVQLKTSRFLKVNKAIASSVDNAQKVIQSWVRYRMRQQTFSPANRASQREVQGRERISLQFLAMRLPAYLPRSLSVVEFCLRIQAFASSRGSRMLQERARISGKRFAVVYWCWSILVLSLQIEVGWSW
jgi:hypothetical protein